MNKIPGTTRSVPAGQKEFWAVAHRDFNPAKPNWNLVLFTTCDELPFELADMEPIMIEVGSGVITATAPQWFGQSAEFKVQLPGGTQDVRKLVRMFMSCVQIEGMFT